MSKTLILRAAILAGAMSAATPGMADEPGPGGTKTAMPVTGEEVYRAVCQSCHMADGKGGIGAATIPALAKNPALAVPEYPISLINSGRGAMPWFTDMLKPQQIAAVVTYIRTHFGNSYKKPVTAAEVEAIVTKPPEGE